MYSLLVMHFAISLIQDGRHEKFSKFYKNRHFLTLFTYLWDPQDQEIWKLVLGRLKWYGYATFHCVLFVGDVYHLVSGNLYSKSESAILSGLVLRILWLFYFIQLWSTHGTIAKFSTGQVQSITILKLIRKINFGVNHPIFWGDKLKWI